MYHKKVTFLVSPQERDDQLFCCVHHCNQQSEELEIFSKKRPTLKNCNHGPLISVPAWYTKS